MNNGDAVSSMQKNGTVVPRVELHPKLMTHRGDSDSYISSARQTSLSSRAVPTNTELAYAGVSAQDGVVQQLSARNKKGSLTGPRGVRSSSRIGLRPLKAITAARTIEQPLQLPEPHQPRAISGTPDDQRPPPPPAPQHQEQPTRSVSYCGASRASDVADNSQESVRRGYNSRSSTARSLSKQSNPYAHVTSVLHEYCNNHITALEAQYRVVRSRSSAALAYSDEQRRGEVVSPRSTETGYTSSGQGQASARLMSKLRRLPSMSSCNRLNSPRPRAVAEGRRCGGVPRAALDAPHIRYAEVLNRMNSYRASSARGRAYAPSTGSARKADFVPEVATRIPDRFKYVPPTEDEKRLHRVATLSALEEWRERERATWEAGPISARAASRNSTPAKSRARTFSQPSPSFRRAHSTLYASSESQLQQSDHEKGTSGRLHKRSGNTASPRSAQFQGSFTAVPEGRAKTPRKAKYAADQRDDQSTNEEAGEGDRRRSARGKRSGTPGRRPQNGAASRTPLRKNRESPQTPARAEGAASASSFRGKLLFDVVAPTVSIG
ncbi:hypothetical protein LSCM4_00468 [Leishmania orientalis]|uniref:Uncharacterized protein n=1 Tax=Leishmania orientalis TaxID=2249476 RepID=A0A836GD42_9TRYP|nr:hypothetical protein LSCM4_00468 [Leishmania orientalis]